MPRAVSPCCLISSSLPPSIPPSSIPSLPPSPNRAHMGPTLRRCVILSSRLVLRDFSTRRARQVVLCTLAFAAFPFLGGVDVLEVRYWGYGRGGWTHPPGHCCYLLRIGYGYCCYLFRTGYYCCTFFVPVTAAVPFSYRLLLCLFRTGFCRTFFAPVGRKQSRTPQESVYQICYK